MGPSLVARTPNVLRPAFQRRQLLRSLRTAADPSCVSVPLDRTYCPRACVPALGGSANTEIPLPPPPATSATARANRVADRAHRGCQLCAAKEEHIACVSGGCTSDFLFALNAVVRWVQSGVRCSGTPRGLPSANRSSKEGRQGQPRAGDARRLLLSSSAYRQRAHLVVPSPPRGP